MNSFHGDLMEAAARCEGCGKGVGEPLHLWTSYFGDNSPMRTQWVPYIDAWFCDICLREYTGWMEGSAKYTTDEEREHWKPACLQYLADHQEAAR